ncbi:MAG: type II toxin-antitoxin system mRNA interferase toxin, RelE/StbE family [Turicibacter sp.]|nr:type II toxin-antitoxin system mRNA interferase toxin, RelE/StbE family [Turicibacter sp.]
MKVDYTKDFNKQFANLSEKKKAAARDAVKRFKQDLHTGTSTPNLRRHALTGTWSGYDSISAGGDLRLHYTQVDEGILFVAVGSHSQLYG